MSNITKLICIANALAQGGDTDCGDVNHATALHVAAQLLEIASDLRANTDDDDA